MSKTKTGPVSIDHDFLRSVDGLTDLQGQEYINHRGLLALGHLHGLTEVSVSLLSFDPESGHAIVSATATGERGTFTDIADASPSNVGPRTKNATPRMSSTRAINRCLRLFLGVGATTAEEIGPEPSTVTRPASRAPTSAPAAAAPAAPSANGEGLCPHCGSDLWDNREQRRKGGKRPAWKSRNTSCDGGKPYNGQPSPWIQWDGLPIPGEQPSAEAAGQAYKKPRSYRDDPNPFVAPQAAAKPPIESYDDPDVPF